MSRGKPAEGIARKPAGRRGGRAARMLTGPPGRGPRPAQPPGVLDRHHDAYRRGDVPHDDRVDRAREATLSERTRAGMEGAREEGELLGGRAGNRWPPTR